MINIDITLGGTRPDSGYTAGQRGQNIAENGENPSGVGGLERVLRFVV